MSLHNDPTGITSQTIWNEIMKFLQDSIGIPKTNKERMVVKRYAKIIYKLIADHLQKT